jgi:dihydrofolate reductase
LRIVVAADKNGVIGKNGALPWHVSEDLKHFKGLTEGGTVIMGYNTYKSIGRALPNRINIVVDKGVDYFEHSGSHPNLLFVQSLDILIVSMGGDIWKDNWFVIGGSKTYEDALRLGIVDEIILTRIDTEVEGGDTFFHVPESWVKLANRKLSDRAVVEYYKKGN